ncbi:type IV toxin-antitoxin system AbiEi family antitoxin [Aliidiomarina haloalkalitolerans]|uniref:Transcriptional regulator AbiEi antitoxin N-terminal domain-containing protein n=1 Tax=Aliidiomarina haloalkalitolerans TaxID=859059 RepID=A0A432VQX1_9GAMM|nr:type IV toxin-antitoxin system AbiEi family antitoxin [Aliidiomarina haloalkalitolerans]RUO18647.1 hypothetical protein CWE06_10410 [Aliidiomarina haloalkalitolerans]
MGNHEAGRVLKEILPLGMVATKQWLQTQGLSLHYIDNAVRRGALIVIVPGVYYRDGIQLSWQGLVASLQRMTNSPIHVGGVSALELHGVTHFISRQSIPTVTLYSPSRLPAWLNKFNAGAQFEWRGTKRLWSDSFTSDEICLRQQEWFKGLPEISYSCAERAYLEVLHDVPNQMSFEHADALLQGLYNLSPRKLELALTACTSVKVKRLFFWLAERNQHAWFKYLKPEKYDLGTGKRVIATQGRLEKKWQITVPREM